MATKRLIDVCSEIRKIEEVLAERKEQAGSLTYKVLEAVKTALEKAPTVDAVEVVNGRWEPRTDVIGFVRCSVCRNCNIYDDWADGKKWNYYPNCGAKMMDGDMNNSHTIQSYEIGRVVRISLPEDKKIMNYNGEEIDFDFEAEDDA